MLPPTKQKTRLFSTTVLIFSLHRECGNEHRCESEVNHERKRVYDNRDKGARHNGGVEVYYFRKHGQKRNPELFAAAVPLCGSAILSTAHLLTDVAIWAFHGTGDKTVWTEGTTRMVEAIRAAGGNKIIYSPISENFGHSIWNPSYMTRNEAGQTPAQWLLEQVKGK